MPKVWLFDGISIMLRGLELKTVLGITDPGFEVALLLPLGYRVHPPSLQPGLPLARFVEYRQQPVGLIS